MIKFEDIKSIVVNCSTENIPAPFSYTYSLLIDLNNQSKEMMLPVTYELCYTERDDLEDEEILDEGFSLNDDYNWSGQLPPIWFSALKEIYANTSWHQKELTHPKNSTSILKITLTDKEGNIYKKTPANQDSWEYFFQELIQAIYEISKKEMPLEVKYKEIDERKQEMLISIQPFFSSRTVEVKIEKEKQALEQKQIPWMDLKPILKSVYFPDYDYQYALEKIPNKVGKYIDNGEGVWYEFGIGVKNPDKNINSLDKLERNLKELVME